jgi:deoxyribodipyrimidine photo-lyase
MKLSIHWLRRDLRLTDNPALSAALTSGNPVQLLFIFDTNILGELKSDDSRVTFIFDQLVSINQELTKYESSLMVRIGDPRLVWKELVAEKDIAKVFFNDDYEPYAVDRDLAITNMLEDLTIKVVKSTDHVIYKPGDLLKDDGTPFKVFSPFKRAWYRTLESNLQAPYHFTSANLAKSSYEIPDLAKIGFARSKVIAPPFDLSIAEEYENTRNTPGIVGTSRLSVHMRFGTVGLRDIIADIGNRSMSLLDEIVWREFFTHILWHFPGVVTKNFKSKYDAIRWRNNEAEFEHWKNGTTGFPIVDAGMRELNATGLMHNRVRMITASFLCKHLLIDWQWGETYFAGKLLDYDLAVNNGNWQWVAGTGCDAAPYFRIFNPTTQQKKFDPDFTYIKTWVPELDSEEYVLPIVDHKLAYQRALTTYKEGSPIKTYSKQECHKGS